ncbi:MAG: M23 family metallopeptidase [Flavobacteriaceae bacterium]|nr:M23 family metallopeptidase [Flavobacteriaceae bacterium]
MSRIVSKLLLVFILTICISASYSQDSLQSNIELNLNQHPPLKIPLRYSGTYGELRPNHFHAGVDLKTQGREGFPVYAVEDGFLSRIKVETGSYGKVVYLDHPELNKTTVYAHLNRFSPKIQNYIKGEQYLHQTYEIQRYLRPTQITVKKGEIIGYSGNTGNSFGPHLHFEVRDRESEEPMNPLQFGLEAKDNDPPTIQGLYLYESEEPQVVTTFENRTMIALKTVKERIQYSATDTISVQGYYSFGIQSFDRLDLSANKNGWYRLELKRNDSLITELTIDRFNFTENPLINRSIDYHFYETSNNRVLLTTKEASNPLGFFKNSPSTELFKAEVGKIDYWKLTLSDYSGNTSSIDWTTKGVEEVKKLTIPFGNSTINQTVNNQFLEAQLIAIENSIYSMEGLDFQLTGDTLSIGPKEVLVRNPLLLQIIPKEIKQKPSWVSYAFFGQIGKKETKFIRKVESDTLSVTLRNTGDFHFAYDSIAPVVTPRNFSSGQAINGYRYLEIEAEDKETGIKSFEGYLDGQWVLFEHEPKQNRFTFDTSDILLIPGVHTLEFEVEDLLGNKAKKTFSLTIN